MSKIKLGHKDGERCEIQKPNKNRVYFPSMHISETELPIESDEVGSMMTATIKMKFDRVRSCKRASEKESFSYDFEVHEIEFSPKKSKGGK